VFSEDKLQKIKAATAMCCSFHLSPGYAKRGWRLSEQTDDTALICRSNTTDSIFKIPVKTAVFLEPLQTFKHQKICSKVQETDLHCESVTRVP